MGEKLNKILLDVARERTMRYFDIHASAKSTLPLEGVLFSNHESLVDPVIQTVGLHNLLREQGNEFISHQKIPHFLAKKELQKTVFKPFYDSLGLIYVSRDNSTRKEFEEYIEQANKLLLNNFIGVYYPGTRSDLLRNGYEEEDKKNAKGGIFSILNNCESIDGKVYPIIPVSFSVDALETSSTSKNKVIDFMNIAGYLTGFKKPENPKPQARVLFGTPIYETFPIKGKQRKELFSELVDTVQTLRKESIEMYK
jgi:1-acyl-sn-glycerol-3-phosphate acyltransferase